ncbi:hypothetical protein ACLKA6_011907 [Drosophila palustris]
MPTQWKHGKRIKDVGHIANCFDCILPAQKQPQRGKSRHKAHDDTEYPFDVSATNADATTTTTSAVSTSTPPIPTPLPPTSPTLGLATALRHFIPHPPPTIYLENALQQRQFANPISYLGGPRLQARSRSNRNSIDSILSLD